MTTNSDPIRSLEAIEIGRTYEAVIAADGRPALMRLVTRGRPRALSGDQVVAARALQRLGWSQARIAEQLEVSTMAVRTALGAP